MLWVMQHMNQNRRTIATKTGQVFRPLAVLATCLLLVMSVTPHSMQVPQLQATAKARYGEVGAATVADWETMVNNYADMPVATQLKQVNDFFNQNVRWVEDIEAWKTADYWATPLETMGRGVGDCEDFSIAKYATLTLMGVPASSLRLVYVKAQRNGLNTAHMVLAWFATPGGTPLILDNMDYVIRQADERGDLTPVFSFNGEQLWLGTGKQATEYQPTARLSRWRQVVEKIKQEGFTEGF
jgi:predicted transglutaminase-like cysteine proteinase